MGKATKVKEVKKPKVIKTKVIKKKKVIDTPTIVSKEVINQGGVSRIHYTMSDGTILIK